MTKEENENFENAIVDELREFQIWMEGHAISGSRGKARMIGIGIGRDFNEAVNDYSKKNANQKIEENTRDGYTSEKAYLNRTSNWNIWRCDLYDNEGDARKCFG